MKRGHRIWQRRLLLALAPVLALVLLAVGGAHRFPLTPADLPVELVNTSAGDA